MEGMLLTNPDAKKINSQIDLLFKRMQRTKYWLLVANDHYDQTFNFFFNSQRKFERLQSVPMHRVKVYDLAYLEQVIKAVRDHTQLTIEFDGFTQQRWPSSQLMIQKRREKFEWFAK